MQKRMLLIGVLLVFVLILVGGFAYFAIQDRRVSSEFDAYIERSKASKPVKVEFAVAVPGDTPKGQIIYLSGSAPGLGNWDSAGVPLELKDDGKWHGSVEVLSDIENGFKVTRGTWGTVETDQNGTAIPDRLLKVPADQRLDVQVVEWVDHGKAVPSRVTTAGDIRLLKKFRSKILGNDRTIAMYLPLGYERNTDQRYPVLYMQDGQNLFDESTSFAGVEWKMDEAAEKLIGQGDAVPFIVVGIYNSPDRTSEFTPPSLATDGKATDGSAARGDLYARFLVEEVKPWIDQTYRTQPDRSHTIIGGSAMGGLISLYAAKVHPEIFGQIMVLSPWLRQADHKLLPDWIGDGKWLGTERIYADMGIDPGIKGTNYPGGAASAIADGKELAAALQSAGLQPDKGYVYREIPDGKHDEASWQGEIEPVLKWVFAR